MVSASPRIHIILRSHIQLWSLWSTWGHQVGLGNGLWRLRNTPQLYWTSLLGWFYNDRIHSGRWKTRALALVPILAWSCVSNILNCFPAHPSHVITSLRQANVVNTEADGSFLREATTVDEKQFALSTCVISRLHIPDSTRTTFWIEKAKIEALVQ